MKKSILLTLFGAVLAAAASVTAFAPAANAGYHNHHHHYHYVRYQPVYAYVSECKWVKFHDHYGHHYYKKICH